MVRMRLWLASAGIVLLVVLVARGQEPAQQPAAPPAPADQTTQNPLFRTGINFVRVDVIVTDKNGNEVSDLKQSDFEVLEDGKPQTVEAFKLVKLDGGATPTRDGPPRPSG